MVAGLFEKYVAGDLTQCECNNLLSANVTYYISSFKTYLFS